MAPEIRASSVLGELERAQQRLRLALEANANRMCTLDYDVVRDRVTCSIDPAIGAGSTLASLEGSLSDWLSRVHTEDRANIARKIAGAIATGDELDLEARIVLGATQRSGWLLVKGIVERDAEGRAISITGVALDNTTRKEGEALRRARGQGERLRALGEMASGIAHDLNQSLALITGYSDMARQELGLERPDIQRVREMVEITGQAAVEGGHALRGLLGFVRSEELMTEDEAVDLADLLKTVARLTAPRWRDAPQAEGRPIELIVDAEPDCVIAGSPPALREAITNLVFNAVDAMPTGGSIRLCARQREGRILVEVSDNGAGIADEIQSRIFDPFFTTKGERGTGLGLPQVLGIVQRHRGTIDVDSGVGRGTTFKLSFPISGQTVSPACAEAAEKPAATPRRHIRILVVEDEEQLARMAGLVLAQRGHRPTVAASGEEALDVLQRERFDLVISDLGLGPGKNGWDLAEAVREHWPGTRFVLVTGWGAAIDPMEANLRGVDRVVAKPYRIAELRQLADEVAATLDSE